MPFTVTRVEAGPGTIMLVYSEQVGATGMVSANYTAFAPTAPPPTGLNPNSVTPVDNFTVLLLFNNDPFKIGDWVQVKIQGVKSTTGQQLDTTVAALVGEHRIKGITEAVEDAVAYPLLTEPVSLTAPAGGTTPMPMGQPSGAPLSSVVTKALSDVLGWKINASDSKGFVGALTQSFQLTELEGHTEATWTPRTYAVQTDLSGGITGAQASLYTRAQDAQEKCNPLFDGLYPLDPEADQEDVKALRELAKSQLGEIVKELGAVGGPSILRVDTYFRILLGTSHTPPKDADSLTAGTLKTIRDVYGISFLNNPLSNSIEDEQDITNFRIIVDYVISLLQTWINNRSFFAPDAPQAFFGTQLVLISRQLSVILETVNEVRFALDSVFIGPSERQTLLIKFRDNTPSIFFEDMLNEFVDFFGQEAPRLMQDSGRLAVNNNILPVVRSFKHMAGGARHPANIRDLPDGFRTVRVRRVLDDLFDQISELEKLSTPVGRDVPPPEGGVFAFPPKVDFGTVFTGSGLTEPISVAVANLAPTPVSSLTASTTDPKFVVLGAVAPNLGAMKATTVSVAFNAPNTLAITQTFSDILSIIADGLTIPVSLVANVAAGSGTAPTLAAIPTSLDFATVTIGSSPTVKSITVVNLSTTPTDVTVATTDPVLFQAAPASTQVGSNQAIAVEVTVNAPAGTKPAQRNETLTIFYANKSKSLSVPLLVNLAKAATQDK